MCVYRRWLVSRRARRDQWNWNKHIAAARQKETNWKQMWKLIWLCSKVEKINFFAGAHDHHWFGSDKNRNLGWKRAKSHFPLCRASNNNSQLCNHLDVVDSFHEQFTFCESLKFQEHFALGRASSDKRGVLCCHSSGRRVSGRISQNRYKLTSLCFNWHTAQYYKVIERLQIECSK